MVMTRRTAKQLKNKTKTSKKQPSPQISKRTTRASRRAVTKRISKKAPPKKETTKTKRAQKVRSSTINDTNSNRKRQKSKNLNQKTSKKDDDRLGTATSTSKMVTIKATNKSNKDYSAEIKNLDEPLQKKNGTSITGFLNHLPTEQDFMKKEENSIYSLGKTLINFDVLLKAPEYEPSNEPISLFRVHDGLEIEEEDEEQEQTQGELFKNVLRDVLKKYNPKNTNEEEEGTKDEDEIQGEQEKMKEKIPEIGKLVVLYNC